MKEYLKIVDNVLKNGKWKGNRTGIRTLTTFCEVFRHNMADGFPLITSKKMHLKSILIELEGFIKGITNKKWYQERGCSIWNEWANPIAASKEIWDCEKNGGPPSSIESKENIQKALQKQCNDLGPIYGYQWRKFGEQYGEVDWAADENPNNDIGVVWQSTEINGMTSGADQLQNIIHTLKTNPDDRRMVCSAWNPNQIHMMALPPCHYAFTLVHIDGKLNLCWKQRSCDLMLGVPFNIASYAALLLLLCKEANLIPGELVGILEDCHIYENHISGAKEQLSRSTHPLSKLIISGKENFNIFDWEFTDATLEGYKSENKLIFEVAI